MVNALSSFEIAYVEAALWSSTDDQERPLDANYTVENLAEDTRAQMVADCQAFFAANADDLTTRDHAAGGHDLWLTRNSHGCGFWDGDWDHEVGERLTAAAHALGSYDLYVGDDGLIYGS